jgi:hypothetical protein
MTIRAKVVTRANIDEITSLNDGVRVSDECLKNPTFFTYSTDDEDFYNELMTKDDFHAKYRWSDATSNENLIEEK